MKKIINKLEKGAALYFVVIAVLMILSVVVGISNIVFIQHMMIRDIGDSVSAFYTADTGIERAGIEWKSLASQAKLDPLSDPKIRKIVTRENYHVCGNGETVGDANSDKDCRRFKYSYTVQGRFSDATQNATLNFLYIISIGDVSAAETGRRVKRAIMLMF